MLIGVAGTGLTGSTAHEVRAVEQGTRLARLPMERTEGPYWTWLVDYVALRKPGCNLVPTVW